MLRPRCSQLNRVQRLARRSYFSQTKPTNLATVSPSIIPNAEPPPPPKPVQPFAPQSKTPYLDGQVLQALARQPQTSLRDIIGHYLDETGNVLDVALPYESRPSNERKVMFGDNASSREVVTIAHCAQDEKKQHKITVSSGFALNFPSPAEGETLVVTCAHTLEEIRQSPLLRMKEFPPSDPSHHVATGTFVCIGSGDSMKLYPATGIVSALPRSDVVIISCKLPKDTLKSLPLSPYPVPAGRKIRAHFVSQEPTYGNGWVPWIGDTWGKWTQGMVLGYRDFAGQETQPGTYDALSHMLFTPFPTAGSSGGPIVDEESGAVVGMMLGSRMDNQVAGVRGWGIPSETIFEVSVLLSALNCM
ncbi:hypothetical protein FA15DRAFT_594957 [Coprinopsis marcescibilis]|uniref:Trypsin-like serine protease n=1 Tax=Coprinopsis marcescibilis TaxID=230819 RepID=A0A5C3KRA4_COPMA|nr:hypothetical protein FA15DRAFT_594957 [Coprinopsis marcescibilis]